MSFTSRTQFPSSAYISGKTPIEPELREWLKHLEQHAAPENLQQIQEYCKSVVENEQEKEKEIALALAKHHRAESGEYKTGMKAVDLIVLRDPPWEGVRGTEKKMEEQVKEESVEKFLKYGSALAPLEDWRPGDEYIVEELAIASNMVPEILHDDDYEWYIRTEPTIFETPDYRSLNDVHLRKLHDRFNFPSKHDVELFQEITPSSIRRGEWVLVSAEGVYDREIGVFGRENEEWAECLELSYFKEYNQANDQEVFIVDNRGRPALHNAERHEQQCALNALWNHPEMDSKVESTITSLDGTGFTRIQEVVEKPNVLYTSGIHGVECSVIASGDNFAAAICRYGGIFVPKRFQALIGDEENFVARLTISTEGAKYPLRVVEINRC